MISPYVEREAKRLGIIPSPEEFTRLRANEVIRDYANGLIEFGPDVEKAFERLAQSESR